MRLWTLALTHSWIVRQASEPVLSMASEPPDRLTDKAADEVSRRWATVMGVAFGVVTREVRETQFILLLAECAGQPQGLFGTATVVTAW